jgi:hypothetical protein
MLPRLSPGGACRLLYPAAGVLATTTERGTWMAPADRIAWTPPGFTHYHRAHGDTEIRLLRVPRTMSSPLPGHPAAIKAA